MNAIMDNNDRICMECMAGTWQIKEIAETPPCLVISRRLQALVKSK